MCILQKFALFLFLFAGALAPRAHASSFAVTFEFVSRPISGIFMFDSVADGTRGAMTLELTSNTFAELGSGYEFLVNHFDFSHGEVTKVDFAARRRAEIGNLEHNLTIISHAGIYDFACSDSDDEGDFGFGCDGDSFRFFSAPGLQIDRPRPVSVSVPAGLPLLLTGLVGMAGFRRMASGQAQAATSMFSPTRGVIKDGAPSHDELAL